MSAQSLACVHVSGYAESAMSTQAPPSAVTPPSWLVPASSEPATISSLQAPITTERMRKTDPAQAIDFMGAPPRQERIGEE